MYINTSSLSSPSLVFSSPNPSTCLLLALQMCSPPPTLPHSRGHISRHVAARAKLNKREQVLTLFPVCQEGSNSARGLNITARALIMFNATLWHQLEEWTDEVSSILWFRASHLWPPDLKSASALSLRPKSLWISLPFAFAQLLETLIRNWNEISALADDSLRLALCLVNAVFTAPQSSGPSSRSW